MPRQKIIRSKCESPDCTNTGKLTRYKSRYICRECLMKDEIPLSVDQFVEWKSVAEECERFGERYEYGDLTPVQVAVGQKSRYRKLKDGSIKKSNKNYPRDPIRFN